MASSGNTWFKKLEAKQARWKRRQNGNTFTPLLTRTATPHAEKAEALKHQKVLMHGMRHGNFVNNGGVVLAALFEGTGLPTEELKAPKTNAERAAEDKRIALPMKPTWAPKPYGKLNRRRLAA
jgi:hypothetical protein